ncbi:MAG TPA: PDZ domain-containing protein [Bavariicoccus seileri]|uniref:PDZ domain-containing protein n=2 Tax=Bavariicoccus seileri TaxID=549685 RepID=A0A3D4S4E7_9ENTE|nr:PDZ domain-containing protein [Bavariicoccus seileri]
MTLQTATSFISSNSVQSPMITFGYSSQKGASIMENNTNNNLDNNKDINSQKDPDKKVNKETPKKWQWREFFIGVVLTSLVAFGTFLGFYYLPSLSNGSTSQGEDSGTLVAPNENDNAETKHLSEEAINQLNTIYNTLYNNYVEKIDEDALVKGALSGMTSATNDPYTEYLDETQTQSLTETTDSEFEGIGATLSQDGGKIIIIAPIKETPADKAGLQANDQITAVDGNPVDGKALTEVVQEIRGKKGTDVVITIKRGSQTQDYTITRDSIPVTTVTANIDEQDKSIGYIQITNFARPTAEELETTIKDLREQGAKRFVIDLRQNPGGLLDQAIAISNMFVPDDKTIVEIESRSHDKQSYKASEALGEFKVTEPTVALIDGGSASASEIVAGAINQSGEVPLVGSNSFGKGTVQNVLDLTDKTELKFTIAKWLTPDGSWIHKKGIKPEYVVERPSYASLLVVSPDEDIAYKKENEKVLNLNQVLAALNYDVEPSIRFDDATKAAIEAFQRDSNLNVTGTLDDDTAAQMTIKLRDKIKENDTQLDKARSVLEELGSK